MGRSRISRALARRQQRAEKKSRSIRKGKKQDKSNYGAKIEEVIASASSENGESSNDIEMQQAPVVCQNKLHRQQLPFVITKKSKSLVGKKNGVVSVRLLSKKKARKLLKAKRRKDRLIERQNASMEVA